MGGKVSVHANLVVLYCSAAAPVRGTQQPSTALVPASSSRGPPQRQPTTPNPPSGAVVRQQEVRQVRSADGSQQAVVVRQQEM